MVRQCYADRLRDMTASEFSEERCRQYEILESFFPPDGKPKYKLLCDTCGKELNFTSHYDFGGTRPRRQAVCKSCGNPTYVVV